jgi:cbb3-type cytochrome oxidase maturation protein
MEIILYLLPFAIIVAFGGLIALIWAIYNNQYEDMEGPAQRILMDDSDYKDKGKHDHRR